MTSALPSVKLDNFEGPFDLLLELARKRKLDLSAISLHTITDDFLQYVQQQEIQPEVQGDFLVVASTLLLLKVQQLLPSLSEEEEEEIAHLTEYVRLYQIYREQAKIMLDRWDTIRLLPANFWAEGRYRMLQPMSFPDCSPQILANALASVFQKIPHPRYLPARLKNAGRTLEECLTLFLDRLRRVKKLIFQDSVKGRSRQEAAISFLAVLELARKKEVILQQATPFENIEVHRAPSE